MTMVINGSGSITGLSAGGLPDATIQPADLSTGAPTWDTSGNVGIGTSSPATKVHLYGATDQRIRFENTGWSKAYQIGNDQNALTFYDVTAAVERARIDTSGNLLVGTTSSSGAGASSGVIVSNFNGTAANGMYMSDTRTSAGTDNAINFGRGSTLVGRLDTTLTSLALTNLSDQRVKTNISNSGSALGVIGSVQVRQFDWTIDDSHEDFGFVAQELN